ncbi:inositol 1,4,5-triphosphate receptor associated 2 isoform X1 [Pantherophis guttatus]|uniref:Inositol 1,4,5-triphosphate receptor associated 2 isoform X1 n=1 Tax=Pantherophis guttatus TaxID=94885 RepID=A0ABM3Z5I5_PANGU|nr:inositol 1,4,5-triphosphate receptor associated 2 isoform X1 [Pantherophis guttatus]
MSSKDTCGKRHHPVASLCRKLQAINMMDQASNPALQIPKFQSKNFDSPQSNTKKNLEEILKKRTLKSNSSLDTNLFLLSPSSDNIFSPSPGIVQTPRHRRISDIRSESFSLGGNKEKLNKSWVLVNQRGNGSPHLIKHGESTSDYLCGNSNIEPKVTSSLECNYFTSSPDLFIQGSKSVQPTLPSPPPKRFSFGWKVAMDNRDNEDSDVSLICEEDLLTTMFSACDVERRGKVAVSKLVDFLRNTTSRSSEDSGLEDLCNMLDPDHRDISMDLETYHAIMKEWIEDCKRNWNELPTKEATPENNLSAKRLNITSGSLEALGGDVSRGDLETSDLITCVADLQFNNQKLQEENDQLKLALDAMEETNNRLVEDGGELRNQIKSSQQSASQVKTLKEELEEVKNTLGTSEEKRQLMAIQNKQLEKENQSLVLKISSLQEENIRNALDSDGLQKKIEELSQNISELQIQTHLYESTVRSKDIVLLKKEQDLQELKSALKEYTSVIETLRVEKNKLLNNVQQMQQELISNGINFPLIYKFNSSFLEATNSLHCELELAQEPSEIPGIEWTALDESLDREVLLLLEGPERVGEKFKATVLNLREELSQVEDLAGLPLLNPTDCELDLQETYQKTLVDLKKTLQNKRTQWLQKLNFLEAQKESLDKELVKMAGNMRRMRTEQLHLKKTLLSRQHEIQSTKQLKEDALAEADVLRLKLQELTDQLEEAGKMVKDRESDFHAAHEEVGSLQKKLEESVAEQGSLRDRNTDLTRTCQQLERQIKEQSTALESLKEKYLRRLFCGVLCQRCAFDRDDRPSSCSNVNEEIRTEEKESCCYQRLGTQLSWPWSTCWSTQDILLLEALSLDSLQLVRRSSLPGTVGNPQILLIFGKQRLRNGSTSDMILDEHKCNHHSVGNQTDADLISGIRMEGDSPKESDAGALTDTLFSELISSEETSVSAAEGIEESQDTDSTLLEPEGKTQLSTLPLQEATVASKEEALEDASGNKTGDSSSCQDLSSSVVCQKNQDIGSPNEKEVEAEFLRLSLGFKCDLFTLEKRVRLEERSRDLAEGSLNKEIAGALKLLDSLASLSEDNQVQEIVKKLQKSLDLLDQHATRIASKAEMLGAVHQESRVSKAVEVMIQHVENLKRTYAREHAELEELKELLLQNEKSFSSMGDRDDSSIKKLSGSLKPSSLRRVSTAPLPRNSNGNAIAFLQLAQMNETDGSNRIEKFNRRSSWSLRGTKQGEKRPSLQRFISSTSWTESEEEQLELEAALQEPAAPEIQGGKARKLSEKETNATKWGLRSLCTRVSSWASALRTSFSGISKALCASVVAVVLFAILITFVMGFSFHQPVEASSEGTGTAWTSVQKFLWPYTRLLHHGPPPV